MIVGGLIAALLAIPAIVYASHQFNDVSNTNTFHDDIAWLADNGITRGCNPPANTEFCPSDAVTRGQMAAFMRRFHETFIAGGQSPSAAVGIGVAERQNSDTPASGNGVVGGLSMNLNIPVSGVLVVTASVDMANEVVSDAFACGINTGGSTDLAQGDSWRVVDLTANFYDTCSTQTALLVGPGVQTARVVITQAEATTQAYGGVIQAVLYTGDGVFGLLDAEEQVRSREISDTPRN
jgi:hypothetical protein